jgi:hypothetical protein
MAGAIGRLRWFGHNALATLQLPGHRGHARGYGVQADLEAK